MDRITIYPNKELRNRINKESEEQKRSLSNLILYILSDYFERKDKRE